MHLRFLGAFCKAHQGVPSTTGVGWHGKLAFLDQSSVAIPYPFATSINNSCWAYDWPCYFHLNPPKVCHAPSPSGSLVPPAKHIRFQILLGWDGMGSRVSLASRVLPHTIHVPSKPITAMCHSGWPIFHLNPPKLAMLHRHQLQ